MLLIGYGLMPISVRFMVLTVRQASAIYMTGDRHQPTADSYCWASLHIMNNL
jgi:hypothetical protein